MYLKYGSRKNVFQKIREVVNVVHGLYMPFNISIVLVRAMVWSEVDEILVTQDSEQTLDNFASYRRTRLNNYHNDNAQLLTAADFQGETVGMAFRGSLCNIKYSVGVNQDFSSISGIVGSVMAHEMGHGFNMTHDSTDCECPDNNCIMQASTTHGKVQLLWSSCSITALETFLTYGTDFCLLDVPRKITLPSCGNGIVELEEECDCGLPEFCQSPCCNATTCTLIENAKCSSGGCCNVKTCQLKKLSTMCRGTNNECDLPEYCDGNSPACPSDVYVQNGAECMDKQGFCYEGKCRSMDLQCHLLWGKDSQSSESCCYDLNAMGIRYGNCGYDLVKKMYKMCNKNDTFCGTLQCRSIIQQQPPSPNYGRNLHPYVHYGKCSYPKYQSTCASVSLDFGHDIPDPGLVATGTKCGDQMACYHTRCEPVAKIKSIDCPNNCTNKGICNNKGECHCDIGYGPPACDVAGPGGSFSSGPINSYNVETRNIKFVTYMVMFCAFPCLIIVVVILYYYNKRNQLRENRHILTNQVQSLDDVFVQSQNSRASQGIVNQNFIHEHEVDSESVLYNDPVKFHENNIKKELTNDSQINTEKRHQTINREFPVLVNVADMARKLENMPIKAYRP